MRAPTLTHRLGRAATSISRNGLRGTAGRVRDWLLAPLWRRLHLREAHVWLTVPIADDDAALPAGYELRAGSDDDLDALAGIGGIAPATARRYLARGARMYVAVRDGDLAFSAWIHERSVPTASARDGELRLPDGVVSLEDSIAAPAHRRSGIASAAIHGVSAREARAGARLIITRIAVDNAPALAWAEKIGCVAVATVRLRRVGPWRRVTVAPLAGGEAVAALLAERL